MFKITKQEYKFLTAYTLYEDPHPAGLTEEGKTPKFTWDDAEGTFIGPHYEGANPTFEKAFTQFIDQLVAVSVAHRLGISKEDATILYRRFAIHSEFSPYYHSDASPPGCRMARIKGTNSVEALETTWYPFLMKGGV